MYIFKQPRIGTPVTPHQDGTFLFNDPLKLVGLWFPIDDATLENGCLWYVPGSHKLPIKSRFKRSPENKMVFDGKDHEMNDDDWVAAPVKKGTYLKIQSAYLILRGFFISIGSVVLIHGQVVHKSEANKSAKSRHAYTFHMVETEGSEYSKENWLQPTETLPFPKLFSVEGNVRCPIII